MRSPKKGEKRKESSPELQGTLSLGRWTEEEERKEAEKKKILGRKKQNEICALERILRRKLSTILNGKEN